MESINPYKTFAEFVKTNFYNEQQILDVGCGSGELCTILYKYGYKVTGMDRENYSKIFLDNNITFINNQFTLSTDITPYDLIIGFHPCEAAELIIRNSLKNDKECIVTLCEIHQGLEKKDIKSRKEYINYLMNISEKLKMVKLPIHGDNDLWNETIYYKK